VRINDEKHAEARRHHALHILRQELPVFVACVPFLEREAVGCAGAGVDQVLLLSITSGIAWSYHAPAKHGILQGMK
jgi:hypothetical protein